MSKRDGRKVMQDFEARRARQLLAIGVALGLVISIAVLHKIPAILGEFSSQSLFGAQVIVISLFIGFSSYNWRCPSCNKYLGHDMNRRGCGKCGARLR